MSSTPEVASSSVGEEMQKLCVSPLSVFLRGLILPPSLCVICLCLVLQP